MEILRKRLPVQEALLQLEHRQEREVHILLPEDRDGQANACAHACTGRIRFVGVLFYDADRIEDVAKTPDDRLVEGMREIVLDPNDPKVIEDARKNGIDENWIKAAQESPSYKLFKKWRIAFPNHPEFRTVPMNFYVPPLSPILHQAKGDQGGVYDPESMDFFNDVERMRIPLRYLANLLTAGNEQPSRRVPEEADGGQDVHAPEARRRRRRSQGKERFSEVGLSAAGRRRHQQARRARDHKERFVIPETHRETKTTVDPRTMYEKRGSIGFGQKKKEFLGRQW